MKKYRAVFIKYSYRKGEYQEVLFGRIVEAAGEQEAIQKVAQQFGILKKAIIQIKEQQQ